MANVQIFGELKSWPSMSAMAGLLSSAGLHVRTGRYSICVNDFAHFSIEEYGGDLGDPQFDIEVDSLAEAMRVVGCVSAIFSQAGLRHRFEIDDGSPTTAGYFHHDWPQPPIA